MKRYIYALLSLVLAIALTGCNSDKKQEATTEENTTTIEQNLTLPTCAIGQGVPTTQSMVTVHVRCKEGNTPIDEATVTVDGTTKPVEYKGTGFSDYIGFRNLQPDRSYKATLEVIVGGETIKKSVKVRTKREESKPTPPVWTKKVYDNIIVNSLRIEPEAEILNLNSKCSAADGNPITYTIIDANLIAINGLVDPNFNLEKSLFIENGILKIDASPVYISEAIVVIRARNKYGFSDTKIKFRIEVLALPAS